MTFLNKFYQLRRKVPRVALLNMRSQNSDYCNYENDAKNCYLCFGGGYNEDCINSKYIFHCRNVVDSVWCMNCELCYEVIDSKNCFNCNYMEYCDQCMDCNFMFDCKSCKNCTGCVGLRKKEYCLFNEQMTKEEYFEKLKKFPPNAIQYMTWKLKRKVPRLYAHVLHNQNCFGDYLLNSKNCYMAFDAWDMEDCMYIYEAIGLKDCMDCSAVGYKGELNYQLMSGVDSTNCNFSYMCWYCQDVWYSDSCFNSHHLFGCTGLNHKEYHILNEPYEKEVWKEQIEKIKKEMRKSGEYGQMLTSTFPYEDSVAYAIDNLKNKQGFLII